MLADTPQGSGVGLSGRSGAASDQTLEVLVFRHPVSLTPIGVPATPFGMKDGQRSEDLIPFTSKGRPAGKPAEGGAELASTILGDPPSQVKQWRHESNYRGWRLRQFLRHRTADRHYADDDEHQRYPERYLHRIP
jgi:hypothetical protein